MALLWNAALTDIGVNMIAQWAQGTGNKLTITGGVIGEGVVSASQLHSLTQLTDEKSTISIQGFESVANGVKLKLRKTSQGITTSFILNQIGIYAKLDTSGGTPIIADSLIAVYQQDTGVLVPTEADSPDFVFTFYGTVQTNYQGDLTINVDTSALASQDDLDALTLAGLADTDADTPSENNLLFFKGSTDKWTAQANPFSNENLLDNPWFTVNQRGFTSGTASTYNSKYTVDRWKAGHSTGGDSGVFTKTSNGMHFEPSGGSLRLLQIPEDPTTFDGKTLTFTVYYAQGTSTTFNYLAGTLANFDSSIGGQFISDSYLSVSYIPAYTAFIVFAEQECTIKAVKLEVGSVSTLHLDVAPDYTTELLICQRYFVRISSANYALWGMGYALDATRALIGIPVPTKMASTPNVVLNNADIKLIGDGGFKSVISATVVGYTSNLVTLNIESASLTQYGTYSLFAESTTAYINISAEL